MRTTQFQYFHENQNCMIPVHIKFGEIWIRNKKVGKLSSGCVFQVLA